MRNQLFAPLFALLDVDRPQLRGDLVQSQLVGLGLARYVLALEHVATASAAELVDLVAPTVQRYLVEPLP
jgi:hypothetical protein